MFDSMSLRRNWPAGGSNDAVSVAWASTGAAFAVGCTAFTDDDNMQYDRRNNFPLGHPSNSTLHGLPHHRLLRHRPPSGPNSSDEIIRTMDSWLYYTVSSVAFSPSGRLYTASYDKTAKVWDNAGSDDCVAPVANLEHAEHVDIVAASHGFVNAFATGSATSRDGISVYTSNEDSPSAWSRQTFSAPRAIKFPERRSHPSCVQWGVHPWARVDYLFHNGMQPDAASNSTANRVRKVFRLREQGQGDNQTCHSTLVSKSWTSLFTSPDAKDPRGTLVLSTDPRLTSDILPHDQLGTLVGLDLSSPQERTQAAAAHDIPGKITAHLEKQARERLKEDREQETMPVGSVSAASGKGSSASVRSNTLRRRCALRPSL